MQSFVDFKAMGGHFLAGAAIDYRDFLRSQTFRSTRNVHCGIAAAVNDDALAQLGLFAVFHVAQNSHSIENA